ncbi:hypothetical protein DPMN_173083 [Dreissena polymorpha]|uniref:Uncharacterized protein n=1 Tax=Dreissena polymorpha TaxID=45954 RepID=A0A9D4IDW4_DREPO|nr:hypothetical protein DPMN_173083 [Dreissena polymorpha]
MEPCRQLVHGTKLMNYTVPSLMYGTRLSEDGLPHWNVCGYDYIQAGIPCLRVRVPCPFVCVREKPNWLKYVGALPCIRVPRPHFSSAYRVRKKLLGERFLTDADAVHGRQST